MLQGSVRGQEYRFKDLPTGCCLLPSCLVLLKVCFGSPFIEPKEPFIHHHVDSPLSKVSWGRGGVLMVSVKMSIIRRFYLMVCNDNDLYPTCVRQPHCGWLFICWRHDNPIGVHGQHVGCPCARRNQKQCYQFIIFISMWWIWVLLHLIVS